MRLHPLVPRESKRWKSLYWGRASVEREFGRLKNEWALLPLRVGPVSLSSEVDSSGEPEHMDDPRPVALRDESGRATCDGDPVPSVPSVPTIAV